MNKKGIRRKLVIYFLSLLTIVFNMLLLLGILHVVIVERYEQIDTNIINQNELINATSRLALSYNSYRNAPNDKNLSIYEDNKSLINGIFLLLDKSITSDDSRLAFLGVRNTINSVIADTDAGVASLRSGDLAGTSQRYDDANRKLDFVRQNVASLLLKEINHSAELQASTTRIDYISSIASAALFVLISIVTIIISLAWSRQIITPLLRLDAIAKKISDGNIEADVDPGLIEEKDEVGSLARSFNVMIQHLRENLNALKRSNEETAKARDSAEGLVLVRTKELTEERSRLLASINSLSFGFLIVDMSGRILLKNRAMLELFGFAEGDGMTINAISEKLGGFDIAAEAERCLKGKVVCETKEIVFDKKILRGIVAPIMSRSDSDDKIGYVLLLEDITEAKVMERSRDEFFAVASHELRTPLTAIRGNAEMIMDSFASEIKSPDVKEMLSDIDASSIRLIDIVNDFLEVSRLEQGNVQIKQDKIDVFSIVSKAIGNLRSTAVKKGISLDVVPPSSPLPMALADANRVEQVLINLAGNSIKFTDKGGVTVRFSHDGSFIKVQVVDTGIGVSEQNQSLLFRKFQQAGEQMLARDVTQGTGLGLYICHRLVSYMGGSIFVEQSELGKGSTFSFTLPIAPQ